MNHRLLLLSLVTLLPWSPVMAGRSKEFTAADRAWWSFQPVHEPSLPGVKDTAWTRTPVDR
jgi:hypothetical protein